jgi:probable O-glycosylation ligase (exosortase A-associated)
MSVFLLLKSQHKFAVGAVGVIVAVALASFMPAEYWGRMETIRTYKEDASAMGRINVWHTAVNVANDRITGAGFEYYGPRAFNRYAPNPEDIHSAHSIYFQSLGEHGWLGLAMFLFIWLYVWSRCRRVIRKADTADDGASMALLARMIQVSLIGFAVGGGFVNIGNWDMMYYLAIAALGAARVADAREASLKSLRVAPPRYRPGKHSTPAFSRRETAKRATAT